MTNSIYKFVQKKLISHGVDRTADGLITLADRSLFLAFVQLERAVRIADFDAVRSAVKRIDEHVRSLRKRHLVVFAYMYLGFSDGTPKITHAEVRTGDGGVLRSVEYRRAVTPEERLIADWGHLWIERFGKSYLRAVYASHA